MCVVVVVVVVVYTKQCGRRAINKEQSAYRLLTSLMVVFRASYHINSNIFQWGDS